MIAGGIDVAALGAGCGIVDFGAASGCCLAMVGGPVSPCFSSAGVATGADFAGGATSVTRGGVTLAPVAAVARDCKAS